MITTGRAQQIIEEFSRHSGLPLLQFVRVDERRELEAAGLTDHALYLHLRTLAAEADATDGMVPLPGIRVPCGPGNGTVIHQVEALCDDQPLAEDGIWRVKLCREEGIALLRLGRGKLPECDVGGTMWVGISDRDLTDEQYAKLHPPEDELEEDSGFKM
jgi:hypothetical protein